MELGFEEDAQNYESATQVANLMEIGSEHYGCSHYRRRCKIRAPCCDEIFDCRHCHNEAKDSLQIDQLHIHDHPRHEVSKVVCLLCETEQDVKQNCSNCGVCMGHAAGTGEIELLKELLLRGVPVDSQSESGTPLIWAAGHDQKEAVKVLLENKANPNVGTEDDITSLLSVVAAGSLSCLELLVQAGAETNVFAGGQGRP